MKNDNALSPAWTGTLAESLDTAHTLSDTSRERIKSELMSKISARMQPESTTDDPMVHNVRREQGWVQLSKRVQAKVLHDDGTSLSWLLKMMPGGHLVEHDHADGLEECMVLEGQLRINGVDFYAGDYQIALPGSVHHEVSSDQGSLVYLRSPSSRRKDLVGL
jgi:anti-sigma factor ChrR (cupin superfamily)